MPVPCLGLKKVDTFRKRKTCQKWIKATLLERATGSFVQNGGKEPCPMNALKLWDNCSRKSKRLSKSFRASISAASKSSTDGLVAISRRAYCLIPHKSPRLTPKSSPCPRFSRRSRGSKRPMVSRRCVVPDTHMIKLAEQQFNIPIRKKSGTKQ